MRGRGPLVLAISMLAGCSLVNDPSEHRAPLPFAELCEQLAQLTCRGYLECCPTAASVSMEACVAAASVGCTEGYAPFAEDPQAGYSAEAAARAAFEGRMLAERCDLGFADWLETREGFQSVLQGTIPGGERCDTPAPTAENLVPLFYCATTDRACVYGGSVWQCASRRARGESCVLSTDCQPGLHCTSLIGGSCEPRKPDTSGCVGDDECESRACRGFVCAPRTLDTVYCSLMSD